MLPCGITWVSIKFQKVSRIPILWRLTTLSFDITWLAWQDHHVVSRVVLMPWNVLCAYSSIVSTPDNCINTSILPTLLISSISLALDFHHSERTASLRRYAMQNERRWSHDNFHCGCGLFRREHGNRSNFFERARLYSNYVGKEPFQLSSTSDYRIVSHRVQLAGRVLEGP